MGYVTIKYSKFVKINRLNPSFLIFNEVNGYVEQINTKRYSTLVLTNESKEKIKKDEELWIKIRYLIRSITKNLNDYDGKYTKIKFNSDGELPLSKKIEIPSLTIVVRAIFLERKNDYNGK